MSDDNPDAPIHPDHEPTDAEPEPEPEGDASGLHPDPDTAAAMAADDHAAQAALDALRNANIAAAAHTHPDADAATLVATGDDLTDAMAAALRDACAADYDGIATAAALIPALTAQGVALVMSTPAPDTATPTPAADPATVMSYDTLTDPGFPMVVHVTTHGSVADLFGPAATGAYRVTAVDTDDDDPDEFTVTVWGPTGWVVFGRVQTETYEDAARAAHATLNGITHPDGRVIES